LFGKIQDGSFSGVKGHVFNQRSEMQKRFTVKPQSIVATTIYLSMRVIEQSTTKISPV